MRSWTVALAAAWLLANGPVTGAGGVTLWAVAVADRDGMPVHGLGRSDLQLLVGGLPAQIESLKEYTPPTRGAADPEITLLFDEGHVKEAYIDSSKAIARGILETLAPAIPVAIATTSGRVALAPTIRRADAQAALDRVTGSMTAGRQATLPRAWANSTDGVIGDGRELMGKFNDGHAFDRLRKIAEHVPSTHSRIAIVWFTYTFDATTIPRTGNRAIDALERRGITVYSVNTAASPALAKFGFSDEPASGGPEPLVLPLLPRFRPMAFTADRTGGFAIINGHALHGALLRLAGELQNFYEIRLAPTAAPRAFVTISSSRPGITVRAVERLPNPQ